MKEKEYKTFIILGVIFISQGIIFMMLFDIAIWMSFYTMGIIFLLVGLSKTKKRIKSK